MGTWQVIANRFEIDDPEKDLLDRGGMGEVYGGRDTQTGQTVAIKILKPEIVAKKPNIIARFVREGEALRQLNHPNIVKMVDAVEDEGQHYLIMEYVEGGSLRDLLEAQGALPIARTLEIALDLADALTCAHRFGIIHRDLKPSNVLLAKDGTPRLTDFGVAYLVHGPRLTQTGVTVGTVDYLSPEACNGEELDARADIWAFGVMLYEMLTGARPFAGETTSVTLATILAQPVPDLARCCPDAPDALTGLVYRMLRKDRRQRISSARQVGAELEAILTAVSPESPVVSRLHCQAQGGQPSPTTGRLTTILSIQTVARKHNLPVQPTPFVGREAELAELSGLLADPEVRLVTILGPGGMGKTRLALEVAAAQIDNFDHGAFFVSLVPLHSMDAIVPAVAEALGFSFYRGEPQQQLLDYLRQKSMLLIMDNLEHLLGGVRWVTDVLQTAPGVKILVTSRARLNVQSEYLFPIFGMEVPDGEKDATQCSAVQLFLTGAGRVRPGFELSADNLRDVACICRLVQGMPLGVLLAAGWVEMLTPTEIVTEISGEIGQGLDFLETDLYDVPERQRSIRAVFDHSWNLLTERERGVFQALSVFRGGFTREAAQQVTGASLRELMVLVNKSLLHRAPAPSTTLCEASPRRGVSGVDRTGGRYEVHELLRQYAAEKLDGSPAASATAHDRHSACYVAALQEWEADLRGARQQTVLEEIEADSENARAAWNWAVERGQVERLGRALEGLCRFYEWRGRYQEGEAACRMAAEKLSVGEKSAAAASGDGLRVWAKTLTWQGVFNKALGHIGLASQLIGQGLVFLEGPELADQDTRLEKAFALLQMGHVAFSSDREEARQLYEQSLALYQALGDRWGTANALDALGWVAYSLGTYGEAEQRLEEGLAIRQTLGDQRGIANLLKSLGLTHLYQGQLEEGERLVRESIAIRRGIGDRAGIADGLRSLGGTLLWLGKFAEAHSLLEECVAVYGDLGFRQGLAFANILLGSAELYLGHYEQARAQGQRGLDLAREIGYQRGIGFSLFVLGCVALAREAYAEARQSLQESVAVYRAIGQQAGLGEALVALGTAARGLGNVQEARGYLYEALRTATEIQAFTPLMLALPAMALLLADQGDVTPKPHGDASQGRLADEVNRERAVELYALASRYPAVANSRLFEDIAGQRIAAVAATLPPDVVAAAQARGQARDLETTVAEILVELG